MADPYGGGDQPDTGGGGIAPPIDPMEELGYVEGIGGGPAQPLGGAAMVAYKETGAELYLGGVITAMFGALAALVGLKAGNGALTGAGGLVAVTGAAAAYGGKEMNEDPPNPEY